MAEITKAAFSKLAGVSKPAIAKAIKTGKLILNSSKKIDDQDPLSIKYMRNRLEKGKDEYKKIIKEAKKVEIKKKFEEKDSVESDDNDQHSESDSVGYDDKEEIDKEYKKVSTEKIKIANAEKLKLLVPIEYVKKKFGKISGVILNYFFPMGDRLAPLVCGICGITDPEVVRQVKVKINDEITRALSEFKKVAAEDIEE